MSISLVRRRAAVHAAMAAAALATTACSSIPPAACAGDSTLVCTAEGPVRGTVTDGVLTVKGIPYAAAPTGERRWQPPAPVTAWTAVRDGTAYGPVCPQLSGADVVGDEDCLTVNVWTQRADTGTAKPVMVFFPGGGNHSFSGQGANVFGGVKYTGDHLVREGAVFVSFNYRLGALGFLTHDTLRGNYGIQDQVALLQWVQRNIGAFGGDAKRVFLFGTSAGGGNLCALLAAPSARGLFHGAALQSSVPTGCELPTLADTRASTGARVAGALGCTDAACLRAKPAEDVVKAVPGTFGVLPRLYGPNVDGQVIPEQPLATIRAGRHAAVPVIVGNSTRETAQFVNGLGPVPDEGAYRAALGKVFGGAADRVAATYAPASFATPRDALVQATTDALFTCASRRVARTLAAASPAPVHRYLFQHVPENDADMAPLGPVHTVEHPFFFAWQGTYRPGASDLAVQRLLTDHWVALATGRSLDGWPAASPGDRYLNVSASPSIAWDDNARCDFWDTVTLPWPHL